MNFPAGSRSVWLSTDGELLMDDSQTEKADLAKTTVEFVITELDTALTFLDIADASGIQETVKRNHENALKAYETVQRLLTHLRPSADEKALIGKKNRGIRGAVAG
jgi:hypothetical protein